MKFLLTLLLLTSSFTSFAKDSEYIDVKKCIPFTDTSLLDSEMPKTAGELVSLAENYCKKGSKMLIGSIPEWWVQYVIYNVCDMKYSVHLERFGTEEEPLASVVCLYEGKNIYGKY